ncbi:MAG TPA: Gfo/Idh/MocA family oxidoreductase, partial [Thermoanaerobaculia bacterium]|nr:Gfo/Idh/MocA family oxidoreductase [Thermoanaerobaculia bacterium]
MSEKIRTGIAGCGYLGRHHARILTELPASEPVGFVEANDATAAEIEAKHGASGLVRCRSVAELLETGATAVIVATPTSTHAEVAEELLAGGADVMVEKPMTVTLEEADRLISIAREKGRVLQVGHIERFNPAVVAVLPLVTEPKFIEAHRLGVFVPRALDVLVVLDLLVHDLDIALEIVKKPVTAIHAVGVPILSRKVDIASIRIEFEGGCVANLTASPVSTEKTRKFRFFQPDWYFSIDTQKRDVTASRLDRMSGPPRIMEWPVTVVPADPLTA